MNTLDYALVTPAKNESGNIPELVDSLVSQSRWPKIWVLVNDSSDDDTVAVFYEKVKMYNDFIHRCRCCVLDYNDDDKTYALGEKYSRVVKFGIDFLANANEYDQLDFIGVLDCDVVLSSDYYDKLIDKFNKNIKLGIAAAGIQIEKDGEIIETTRNNKTHAPGGIRLWRKKCIDDTGYHVSISQDAVSAARAIMMGWDVRSFNDISVTMRKRGKRYGYDYYGKSAYTRGLPTFYVFLSALKLVINGRIDDARLYLNGFNNARNRKDKIISDQLALKYFRNRAFYKIIGK